MVPLQDFHGSQRAPWHTPRSGLELGYLVRVVAGQWQKESKMVELGVFLPVLNNGWIVSTAAPQYHPTYAMNKAMTLLAEDLGFSFVLSPTKYRGFGGPTEQWDYVLESFEVMTALAEATDRIRLYGSVALPTVHPAITARRGATI